MRAPLTTMMFIAAFLTPFTNAIPANAALAGANAALTRAPYLTDSTQTSVQVTWATSTQSKQTIKWGPVGNCTANSATSATLGNPITIGTTTEYQNSVAVTGLTAGTTYCYRVFTGGTSPIDLLGTLTTPSFTTLAAVGSTTPVTFDVFGDWGDTTNSNVNDGSTNVNQANVDAHIASSGAQFGLSTGDIAYPNGTQTNYGDLNQTGADVSGVFGPAYWSTPGQSLPLFSVPGNHGQNANFNTIWPQGATTTASNGSYAMVTYPSSIDGTKGGTYPADWYAFSVGNARFYVLDASWADSDIGTATGGTCGSACAKYQVDHDAHWTATSNPSEYTWLQNDLAAHPGGIKFAAFHFPLRSDDSTEPDDAYLQNTPGSTGTLEQLLHDGGVSMVFNGHAHIYQRNVAPPGGVTSYVSGGGGAKSSVVAGHGCETTDAYAIGWSYTSSKGSKCGAAPTPTTDSQVYHFLEVTLNGSKVTVTPTDSNGNTFDVQTYDFTADTTAPTAPGALTATQPISTTAALTWTPATDNVAVYAYDIYRNGTYLATLPATASTYTDTASATGTVYTVKSRDIAGNTNAATVTVGAIANPTPPPITPPLFSDGFESGNLTGYSTVNGMSVQQSLVHSGSNAVRETSAGTATYAYHSLGGGYTELWAQAWVYSASHSTSVNLFGFRTTGSVSGSSILNVYLDTTGRVSVRNNIGLATTYGQTTIANGGWHLIKLHAVINGTSSSFDVSSDGVAVPGLSLTGQNLGTTPIGYLSLGDTSTARTFDAILDDVTVSNSAL